MNAAEHQRRANNRPAAIGFRFLLASACAVLLGAAAALRGPAEAPMVVRWLAFAGGAAALLGPFAAAAATLRGHRSFWRTLLLVAAVSAPALAIFGRLLKATTHHRPLGAATFTFGAAIVLLLMVAASARIVSAAESRGPMRILYWSACALGAVATVLLCAPALLQAGAGGSILDGALLVAAAAGTVLAPARIEHRVLRYSPALWAALVGVALAILNVRADLRSSLTEQAPVYGMLAGWL